MADRSIKVTLRADIGDFESNMRRAATAASKVGDTTEKAATKSGGAFKKLRDNAERNKAAWETSARAFTLVGAGLTAGFAGAVKSAVSWESAFAGVRKTVDASESQFAALSDGLRKMTGEVSASHEEIAAVAEAAGQLGIQTPNILAFTRTMIDLGEATNLTAEEAATSLARFANVMGTSQAEFSNLGSAIVDLGNNYATTEAEIVSMAMRLAGAGKQAGLTEGQVLGLATALSSVGIEAQAGGSAMSRVMIRMKTEVEAGGKSLESFARVAGMTGDKFADLFKKDPSKAITAFVQGLGEVESKGGSVQGVLEELGLTELRVADALRRASSASDLFNDAMERGQTAYKDNTALAEEAAQRYATSGARAQMAWNQIKDAAISAGDAILPLVGPVADGIADIAGAIASLPAPVQGALVSFTGLAGVTALGAGAFMRFVPAAIDTAKALETVGLMSGGAVGKVGKLAGAIGKIGLAGAAVGVAATGIKAVVNHLNDNHRAATEMAQTMLTARDAVDAFTGTTHGWGPLREQLVGSKEDFQELLNTVSEYRGTFGRAAEEGWASLFGDYTPETQFLSKLKEIDNALTSLSFEDAQAGFQSLASSTDGSSESLQNLLAELPGVKQMLFDQAYAAGMATDDNTLLKLAMGELSAVQPELAGALDETTGAVEDQSAALGDLIAKQAEAAGLVLSEREAQRQFQEAMEATTAAIEKNGATLDITTAAGIENERALDGVAEKAFKLAESMAAAGEPTESIHAVMTQARAAFIEAGISMGLTGEEAAALADKMHLLPEEIAMQVTADTDEANSKVDEAKANADGTSAEIKVGADTTEGENSRAELENKVKASSPSMKVEADTRPGWQMANWLRNDIEGLAGAVTVNARDNLTGPVWAMKNSLPTYHTITVGIVGGGGMVGSMYAAGGPVHGPGTGTSDSIPARLSNGEHVLTAREVAAAGGHNAIFSLRSLMSSGALKTMMHDRGVPGFAAGGAPGVHGGPAPVVVPVPQAPSVRVSMEGQRLALVLDDGTALTGRIEQISDARIINAAKTMGRKR